MAGEILNPPLLFPMGYSGDTTPVGSIQTIISEASTDPSQTKLTLNAFQNAFCIWTGDQLASEALFFVYVKINGGTTKNYLCFRWQKVIIPASVGATIAIGTSDGRTLKVSAMNVPAALEAISGSSGTANADEGMVPLWSPSAAHITLADYNSAFILESDGTERPVFISEYDGAAWTPVRFVILPASTDIKVRCTYKQIAIANEAATAISITAPTGATIGGTSSTMAFDQVATGLTYNVSNLLTLVVAMATAVAGDEIVLASGTYDFTTGVDVTSSLFNANELLGNQGAEGIIIRSATGDPADVTIIPNNTTDGWNLNQVGASQYTLIKGITFNISGVAAYIRNIGGKFRWQDCRITGNSTSTTAPSFEMNSASGALMLDALRVQADDSAEDCFDGNGTGSDSGTTSIIRLVKCVGFDSGTTNDNQQVLTTHQGQRIEVYGGEFYDARLYVIETDSNAASIVHLFFSYVHDGSAGRRGQIGSSTCFFMYSDSSAADQLGIKNGGYSIGTKATRDGFISSSPVFRFTGTSNPQDIILFSNRIIINTGRGFHPSLGAGEYAFNVISGAAEGFRINDAASLQSNSNFRNNTVVSCTTAFSMGDADMVCDLRNNATSTNTNSVAGVTAGAVAASITSNYNHWDPTCDPDLTLGANDSTSGNAAVDSNAFPTDGGNCDQNGDGSIYDWANGGDVWNFPLIYKTGVVCKGARQIPEIVANADVFPPYWV